MSEPASEAGTRSFRLTLEYDGTAFEGWQVQRDGQRTVQGSLEDAIAKVTGRRVRVTGAGRTDAGVHAEGQVAGVRVETRLDANELRRALNGVLSPDVAVLEAAVVPESFHARHDARAKLYRYRIWNAPSRSPLRQRRALCLERPLDVAAMAAAARAFEGEHDFASLQAAGSDVIETVRTLFRCEVRSDASGVVAEADADSPGEIAIEAEGSGFLRHMVRNLAGTLIEVGRGRRTPESIPALLAARDRRLAGPTAPAEGLTLVWVRY